MSTEDRGRSRGTEPPLDTPTSVHVRRARQGDKASLSWVIERFSPLLLAAARYHMRDSLSRVADPEDVLGEVWLSTLPRLADLDEREGRLTPVLLKFLTSTLRNKVYNLLKKQAWGKSRRRQLEGSAAEGVLSALPAESTNVLARLVRGEVEDAVLRSLERLSPGDRELIILRGIEQRSYKEIAALQRVDDTGLRMRYRRALEKLRQELPGSVYGEFRDE
jgi:RNA polymerase sigma factor (sigma-70 family)